MPVLAKCGGTPLRTKKDPGWTVYGEREKEYLARALAAGSAGQDGPFNREFRERFARFSGVKHCFTVANGTVSIELILRAYGIGYGDEVIVTPYTFIASVSSLVYAGVTPVFADVDPETFQLSPEAAERAITPRTKAIMPVYVGGCPDRLDEFRRICEKHGLILIGDAAQAVGAEYGGKGVAACADATSISCQNTKNLTCGEGGIILTDDDSLADRLYAILHGGVDKNGSRTAIGLQNGMSEYQAAVLLAQLDALPGQIARRAENGAYLDARLGELDFVRPLRRDPELTANAFHLYMFRLIEEKLDGLTIGEFLSAVRAEGVTVTQGYRPVYTFPCMASDYVKKCAGPGIDLRPDTPAAERISRHEACWIPQYALLGEKEDMDDYVSALCKVYENRADLKEGRRTK
ncbi:MAG: DegT/DnrJ/EryC1/StrS family aminotransferase [Clostridia bacterium]|nr:DegT/DnrJ/EryC1/StrS family aminotransferase [Clostridia bacterium]